MSELLFGAAVVVGVVAGATVPDISLAEHLGIVAAILLAAATIIELGRWPS